MSKTLGPYIPLIIVNCIIICRCEVCASKQGPIAAGADAIGQSLGFAIGLGSIAVVRELLGTGGLFGIPILTAAWPDWVIMVLPPGAFFTFGILLGMVNWYSNRRESNAESN
jgi:electron transport complex protein RnfE